MANSNTLLHQAIRSAGGETEFQRKKQLYDSSLRYFEKNREELLKKYAECWIAIFDSRVVAHNKSLKNLLQQIEEEDVDVRESLIEYISNRKQITLF